MMNDFKLYTPFVHFHLLVGIFAGIENGCNILPIYVLDLFLFPIV
jgi:hypothetical protein